MDAPLLRAWQAAEGELRAGRLSPFTIPGHKQRGDLFGTGFDGLVAGDLPLYGGLAPIRHADDLLRGAERRAADHFGADWCRFSVGGSTHGNQAMALAVGRPGRRVLVSRTLHRSMLLGLVLAGLVPVWLRPPTHPGTGLPQGLDAATVRSALIDHPDVCAVLITDPSYVGTCADVGAIAEVTSAAGVPLVVDAAWGGHFGLHPHLPPAPLAAGADAVVTSAHKTLPAMNQAAILLARTRTGGGLLDADRLDRAVDACATTSPSGAILASLDGARALLADRGAELAAGLLTRAERARTALRALDGVVVPDAETFSPPTSASSAASMAGPARFDAAKLVLLLAGAGADGLAIDDELETAGLPLELADRDVLIPMLTLADQDRAVDRLVAALTAAIERHRGVARPVVSHPAWTVDAEQVVSPREAFFAEREAVPSSRAAGRICAELVAPYPPGVPVLAPGEVISADALQALAEARAGGARIAYAADPGLATVQVLR